MGSVSSYQSGGLEHLMSSSPAYIAHSEADVPRASFVPVYSSAPAHDTYHRSASYLSVETPSLVADYAFAPDDFLRPGRMVQPFVGDAEQIEHEVKEAFRATAGFDFPTDIRVSVLSSDAFNRHNSDPHVVGFSLNRRPDGLMSDVFVRADEKDRVLLTIGHEIGHVFSLPLAGRHNEEAKAFAFSRAWMDAIQREDIAGLGNSIVSDNPARNGLHDVACAFVWDSIRKGKDALELFWELVRGDVGVAAL